MMDTILYLLPALACGVMMIGCALMMARMHGGQRVEPDKDLDEPDEIARLRDELARLQSKTSDPTSAIR